MGFLKLNFLYPEFVEGLIPRLFKLKTGVALFSHTDFDNSRVKAKLQ